MNRLSSSYSIYSTQFPTKEGHPNLSQYTKCFFSTYPSITNSAKHLGHAGAQPAEPRRAILSLGME